jgi:chorismate synthase
MNRIRFLTAGESHGRALTTIIEGVPANLGLCEEDIERDLKRRQRGYGRGGRMQIESDRAQILSGVRYGKTLGSPIALLIENKDWPNWIEKMSVKPVENPVAPLQMPRPGHADFAGMVKYQQTDLRNILERSSARETAMRVAAGAIAKKLLAEFGIKISGHVLRIGQIQSPLSALTFLIGKQGKTAQALSQWESLMERVEQSPVACADASTTEEMIVGIDKAKEKGDTLGGLFEIVATGIPVGLGSHVHWERRLDGQIAQAMMSINAMKAVEIGLGRQVTEIPGSQVHDQIFYEEGVGYYRGDNNAGGIEGGMSNGEPVIVRVAMKPLPTLSSPLHSVDVSTHEPKQAFHERSDVCAVPAAVVVGEAMLALILANALCEKLGGDSIAEMQKHFKGLPIVPLGW